MLSYCLLYFIHVSNFIRFPHVRSVEPFRLGNVMERSTSHTKKDTQVKLTLLHTVPSCPQSPHAEFPCKRSNLSNFLMVWSCWRSMSPWDTHSGHGLPEWDVCWQENRCRVRGACRTCALIPAIQARTSWRRTMTKLTTAFYHMTGRFQWQ